MSNHHLFLSYARKDNETGWVSAFHERLLAQHQRDSGRGLRVFFDQHAIANGADWERHILQGLRSSQLLLAFLSPNFIASPWCKREWEEYLRLEHTLARGDDGIQTVYFVTMPQLDAQADLIADPSLVAWIDDLRRRHRGQHFDLRDWSSKGADLLREIDARERLAELRADPSRDTDRLVTLAERVAGLDRVIAHRLDRATLAELAPGNLDARYPHFVGRHEELCRLHAALVADRIGLVGALHGLGGQGKTALAIQYAYAYAEFYAAGGRWFLSSEGRTDLAATLEPLIALIGLSVPRAPETLAGDAARNFTLDAIFAALEKWTRGRLEPLRQQLSTLEELHTSPAHRPDILPRLLLILDNVDRPELLDAPQLARFVREDWLNIIVTTRLDPADFGGDAATLTPVPVDDLPAADALALLRALQPDSRFSSPAEEESARAIVTELGGFTLAVELVGAYAQAHPRVTLADYLVELRAKGGLPSTDEISKDVRAAARIRHRDLLKDPDHRQSQIAFIVDRTLATLRPMARNALAWAALLPPDHLVVDWLGDLTEAGEATGSQSPEDRAPDRRSPARLAWLETFDVLMGRRLVLPVETDPTDKALPIARQRVRLARIHRLVAEYLVATMPTVEKTGRLEAMIAYMVFVAHRFEKQWPHDPSELSLLRPLEEAVTHLLTARPDSLELAAIAGVAATAELETGQLLRAEALFGRFHDAAKTEYERNEKAALLFWESSFKLADFLTARGRHGDAEEALGHYQRSLALAEQLARDNPGSAKRALDVSLSLVKLAGSLAARGQLGDADLALGHYQRSLTLAEQIARDEPDSAYEASRQVFLSLLPLADSLAMRGQPGDAALALGHYKRSLTVAEQLAREDPGSTQAARDVSMTLNKLADFLAARGQPGDAEQALGHCQRSLTLVEQLARDSPASAQAARDVSMGLLKLANFLAERGQPGDRDQALRHVQRSRDILEQLARDDPGSAQAVRNVSMILNELGDFLMARGQPGDAEQAVGRYQRSLALAEQLADDNPGSAQATRDVSVSLLKLADFLAARSQPGDADLALGHYQRSLALAEQHARANPGSAQQARDVSVCLERLADLLMARGQPGDLDQALLHCQRNLTMAEQLARDSPGSAQVTLDLLVSLERMANIHGGRGNYAAAWHDQRRALELGRQLGHATSNYGTGRTLIVSLVRTAGLARTLGDQAAAAALFKECYALLHQFHSAGTPLDPAMRQLHKQLHGMFGDNPTLLDRAMRWLKRVTGSSAHP